jgi:hypothetical protein
MGECLCDDGQVCREHVADELLKLKNIEQLCLATKKDQSEIRWVRMFATDVLRVIDPQEDWDAVAYKGKERRT